MSLFNFHKKKRAAKTAGILIGGGADVDAEDEWETTPMFRAIMRKGPGNDHLEMSNIIYSSNAPTRGGLAPPDYFDDVDQMSAAAAMYDPSALTFSDPSLADDEKCSAQKFISGTDVSDEESEEIKSLPGYHWDYCEVSNFIVSNFHFYTLSLSLCLLQWGSTSLSYIQTFMYLHPNTPLIENYTLCSYTSTCT